MSYCSKKKLVMSIVYSFIINASVSMYAQENPIVKIMSEGTKDFPSKKQSSFNQRNSK